MRKGSEKMQIKEEENEIETTMNVADRLPELNLEIIDYLSKD
jgi:hypothetical protein